MRILAFDPGGTTGVAYFDTDSVFVEYKDYIDRFYLGANKEYHHEELLQYLMAMNPDVVVTERFDYRKSQKHADLISVEYIGVMRLFCRKYRVPFIEQKQLKGHKGLWTDDKLKAMGLWISGELYNHAMDATRQLLYYMTETLKDNRWIEAYSLAMGVEIE